MNETLSPAEVASAERAAARKKLQEEKNAKAAEKRAAKKSEPKPAKASAKKKVGVTTQVDGAKPKRTAASRSNQADAPAAAKSVTPSASKGVTSTYGKNLPPPTTQIASEFQQAFEFFNRDLFDSVLPNCVIVIDRLKKAHGMFCPKRWDQRDGKRDVHEIRIDTSRLVKEGKGDKDVLGTLVHEMAHLAIEHAGYGPKKAYHCKRWAALMNDLGLKPMAIVKGVPVKDKETGANCTHAIVKGGPFDQTADKFLKEGFSFTWATLTDPPKEKAAKKSKAGAKVAHECPDCGDKAWGKASLKLVCGGCKVPMLCEQADDADEGDDD